MELNRIWFSPYLTVLIAVVIIGLFYWLYWFLKSRETLTTIVNVGLAGLIGFFQILALLFFRISITTDDLRVKTQAYALANGAKKWDYYFYQFPNNVNTTIVYSWLVKLFKSIFPNHIDLAIHITLFVLFDLAIFALVRTIQQITNQKRSGTLVLMAFMLMLPTYTYALNFYTDPLMIAFPVFALSFFVKSFYSENASAYWRNLILGLLLMGCGYFVKPNVIIIVLALFMAVLVSWHNRFSSFKRLSLSLVTICVMLVGVKGASNIVAGSNDFTLSINRKVPTEAFIYMGLNPDTDGQINAGDMYRYVNVKSPEKRKVAYRTAIIDRIHQMKFNGVVSHMWKKLAFTFSRGVVDSDSSNLQPNSNQWIARHLYVIFFWTSNITQGMYLALLIGMFAWGIIRFRTHGSTGFTEISMFIVYSILGVLAFHVILWEAEARYAFLVLPFMIIAGILGLHEYFLKQDKVGAVLISQPIVNVLIAALLLVSFATNSGLSQKVLTTSLVSAEQSGSAYGLRRPLVIHAGESIKQKFVAPRSFKQFGVQAELRTNPQLRVGLLNKANGKFQKFSSKDELINIKNGKKGNYELIVKNISNQAIDLYALNYSPYFSLIKDGEGSSLITGNGKHSGYYIHFTAYTIEQRMLMSNRILNGFIVIVGLLALVLTNAVYLIACKRQNLTK